MAACRTCHVHMLCTWTQTPCTPYKQPRTYAGVLVEESKYAERETAREGGGGGGGGRGWGGHAGSSRFRRRNFRARPGVAALLELRRSYRLGALRSTTFPRLSSDT